jgi:hypothetical protein
MGGLWRHPPAPLSALYTANSVVVVVAVEAPLWQNTPGRNPNYGTTLPPLYSLTGAAKIAVETGVRRKRRALLKFA